MQMTGDRICFMKYYSIAFIIIYMREQNDRAC